MTPVTINLALQGGGAHGAFTWGVLDRLLEEPWIEFEGITATSAGAMNAAALKGGYVKGGRKGAKVAMDEFWNGVSDLGTLVPEPVQDWLASVTPPLPVLAQFAEWNPALAGANALTRLLSPYDLNPLDLHPLRSVVDELLDFGAICADTGPKLFIAATNVRSGKIRVFEGDEITTDAILASACLPTLYQAVEVYDPKTDRIEAYWDGGYIGNPALFPLFYATSTADILIVHINPTYREDLPRTARDIENRINEISFNSSLFRELRGIEFVQRLIERGQVSDGDMKYLNVHSLADDKTMTALGVATKVTPTRGLLGQLKSAGQFAAEMFLTHHADDLGKRSSCDLRAMFS